MTRSSGFTLIELLVVVAILGILSAIGTLAYNGYVSGAKKSSAENYLQQIALAQTEEYSSTGQFCVFGSGATFTAVAENPDGCVISLNRNGAPSRVGC